MKKNIKDASKVKISELPLVEESKFEYLFYFGDEWLHEITVEKIVNIFPETDYPVIIKKSGTSPEQYPEEDDL